MTIGWDDVGVIFIIAGPVAYGTAKFLMSKYAEQWIKNKFDVSLETLRHEQAKTMSMLKIDVDSVLAGRIKIQEREFESLGTAWQMLSDLMVVMSGFMAPGRIESSFARFSDADWTEFLERHGAQLSEIDKRRILGSANRSEAYHEVEYWRELGECARLENDVRIYLAKFGIFMPAEIVTRMEEIALAAKSVINHHRVTPYSDRYRIYEQYLNRYQDGFKGPYDRLQATIKGRLASHGLAGEGGVKSTL
ncbi:hypothetical protein [Herbaspirillum rubrisubalbicans]|nr:hypothetical protein [Herbaspirillum rubrisubalbicans]